MPSGKWLEQQLGTDNYLRCCNLVSSMSKYFIPKDMRVRLFKALLTDSQPEAREAALQALAKEVAS